VQEVHEAWARLELAGALLMDVKGAFDHVAPSRLTDRMLEFRVDGDLICWVCSFLMHCRIQLIVDRFQYAEKSVSTGVPQGSPASLILFAIYISRIFEAIKTAVSGVRALSFSDNIDIVVLAGSVDQACKKL
jgi:hypothetical protein